MAENNFFKRPTIPPYQGEPEREPSPLPKAIGPYPIEALLERGGMSLLYLGSHPETQVPITIKVLSPKFLSHPEMTSRFLKEAEIIALADHPNIVKLFGYGRWEGGLYIAMEFIQGISLRQYILQNTLSLRRALEIVLEIAYALCHLHTHGVIHRDLKPENILVNEKGHIKVIDFGIAQLIDPLELEKIKEQQGKPRLIGTPIYMSPEQRANPESVSYPSDIYSLGIIAYELVLGKLQGGQIHLSLMPKGLQKILAIALQPNFPDRYLDIVDFISDLSSYLHSPQFEKEQKIGDQASLLFEKMQTIQLKLIPDHSLEHSHIQLGLVIHRPLGLSGILVEPYSEQSLLVLGESSGVETDSLLQILYVKGVLDGFSTFNSLEALATRLNNALLHSPTNFPLSLGMVQWDFKEDIIRYLSCGYGPCWKISDNRVSSHISSNIALGISAEFSFTTQHILIGKGDKIILCPLSATGTPFTLELFQEILEENKHLPPQPLAEAIYRKAKSQELRYFDEHPFVVAVLGF